MGIAQLQGQNQMGVTGMQGQNAMNIAGMDNATRMGIANMQYGNTATPDLNTRQGHASVGDTFYGSGGAQAPQTSYTVPGATPQTPYVGASVPWSNLQAVEE
jgi:hypothetical protein